MDQNDLETSAIRLQKRIGYTFKDKVLLQVALTHPSLTHNNKDHPENNQRMEFLGDAVLDLILAEELYKTYPDEREGFLGQCRSSMVRGILYPKSQETLKFRTHYCSPHSEERNKGRNKDSNLEDALESLTGAIYLDSDYKSVRKVVLKWFKKLLQNLEKKVAKDNPKGNLQEAVQAGE